MHFRVKGLEDGVGFEELFESLLLQWIESMRGGSQGGEIAAMVLECLH